ncbi:GIY-YIG nuclease family protein, partial [Cellulomonas aerilata]|uniref:GIY-YIG nuclease family protein n=1 Tax=Cellulomonas aerilata TaxID=515326 RepID=UPI0031E1CC31
MARQANSGVDVGGIYVLRDAITHEVRYVGRTEDFAQRAKQHAARAKTDEAFADLVFTPLHGTDDLNLQRGLEQHYLEAFRAQHADLLNRNEATGRSHRERYLRLSEAYVGRTGPAQFVVDGHGPDGREQSPGTRTQAPNSALEFGGIYVLRDPETHAVRYIGRTEDFGRRAREHALDDRFQGLVFTPYHGTNDLNAQRGLEQYYYERFSAVQDVRLLNESKPINPSHPLRDRYREDAAPHVEGRIWSDGTRTVDGHQITLESDQAEALRNGEPTATGPETGEPGRTFGEPTATGPETGEPGRTFGEPTATGPETGEPGRTFGEP